MLTFSLGHSKLFMLAVLLAGARSAALGLAFCTLAVRGLPDRRWAWGDALVPALCVFVCGLVAGVGDFGFLCGRVMVRVRDGL